MTKHTQECEKCKKSIDGEIYHLGFSNIEAVYCSSCPNVLLIEDQDFFSNNGVDFPNLVAGDKGWQEYNKHLLPYYKKAEKLFPKCECGGSFQFMAPPRCANCNEYLSGNGYDNKPYYRNHKYVFVSKNSVSI